MSGEELLWMNECWLGTRCFPPLGCHVEKWGAHEWSRAPNYDGAEVNQWKQLVPDVDTVLGSHSCSKVCVVGSWQEYLVLKEPSLNLCDITRGVRDLAIGHPSTWGMWHCIAFYDHRHLHTALTSKAREWLMARNSWNSFPYTHTHTIPSHLLFIINNKM